MDTDIQHRIVIVGGGAGGLELAVRLGRKSRRKPVYTVTLIDKSLTHIWKPLLHEVAAGTLDAGYEADNFLALARHNGFRFRPGTLIGLNRSAKTIQLASVTDSDGTQILPATEVTYDTLVLAVGSESNDFGIPGVKEHCIFLDSRKQADHFQKLLVKRLLALQYILGEENRAARSLQVAIVGAGATGVELAAELHNLARKIKGYGFDSLDAATPINVTLIEAAPRILPALARRVSSAAERLLKKRGIQLLTSSQVQSVTEDAVHLAAGKAIRADLKVWAAGIKAPELLSRLDGLAVNRLNQLNVNPDLSTTTDPDIFALGDCAHCPQPGDKRPVPPRAQAAHQQADLLTGNLISRLAGRPLDQYVYYDHGSLISLSQSFVGNLMGNLIGSRFIEGYLARFIYLSLYRSHQVTVHGSFRTLLMMMVDGLKRRFKPRMKLH